MTINWLGHACFKIRFDSKTLVIDPFGSKIGFSLPEDLTADIVTVSHSHFDHSEVGAVSGNPKVIRESGVFNLDGINIKGIKTFHDKEKGTLRGENIVFIYELEGFKLCHLGDLGHVLENNQISEIGEGIDILMIPVGGNYTIDHHDAWQVIDQLNPKIILPMHYLIPGLNVEIGPVEPFIEISKVPVEQQGGLSIDKNNIPREEQVIILSKT